MPRGVIGGPRRARADLRAEAWVREVEPRGARGPEVLGASRAVARGRRADRRVLEGQPALRARSHRGGRVAVGRAARRGCRAPQLDRRGRVELAQLGRSARLGFEARRCRRKHGRRASTARSIAAVVAHPAIHARSAPQGRATTAVELIPALVGSEATSGAGEGCGGRGLLTTRRRHARRVSAWPRLRRDRVPGQLLGRRAGRKAAAWVHLVGGSTMVEGNLVLRIAVCSLLRVVVVGRQRLHASSRLQRVRRTPPANSSEFLFHFASSLKKSGFSLKLLNR